MLLVVILVASTCSTAFAIEIKDGNDDGKINLVTLGASNTNGYGIRGYLPASVTEDPLAADKSKLNVYGYERAPETAYPAQVAAMLEETTGAGVDIIICSWGVRRALLKYYKEQGMQVVLHLLQLTD